MNCKKHSYATEEEAMYVIRQIHIRTALSESTRRTGERSCYFCHEHKAWHITSQSNGKKHKAKGIDRIKKIADKEIENEAWEEKLNKNKKLRF